MGWSADSYWLDLGDQVHEQARKSLLSVEDIDRALAKGAEHARALRETLRDMRPTHAQMNLRLR